MGRSQVTRIGSSCSSSQVLFGGIPQGTKLGAILFAVMVNDLMPTWALRAKFVDDLSNMEILPRNSPSILNYLVDDIQNFACNNNMRLNPVKCKTMLVDFLHYNSCVPRPIATCGLVIEEVPSFKLLGVHLSANLTWGVHCDYIIEKANNKMFVLRQLKKMWGM